MPVTVAFLSLFFGLISGPYPVELAVDGPVAAVEVVVDGRSAGRLQGPPWKGVIDFGPQLLPHRIVARALDAQGHELGRAEEWANLPHPLAKVDIALERAGSGPPVAAKVTWKDLAGEQVRAVSLTFDGLPVKLDADGRAALPPHDLLSLHFLTAEIELGSHKSVRQDLSYGGEYGSEVATELTGVPVHAPAGSLPPAAKLGGWLVADGKPLSVDAVEKGPAQLYVVSAPTEMQIANKTRKTGELTVDLLAADDQIRFLVPAPRRIASDGEKTDLFQITSPLTYRGRDFLRLMLAAHLPPPPAQGLRIADAVATAGLAAMTENRRRAVLLVLSGNEQDASRYDPATVRRFLAALRVPLFVWSLGEPKPGSTAAAWGAQDVALTWHLATAVSQVRKEVDAQRIVMVDGRLLPQSIALSPAAAGLELAGAR
jgi:hypothetical protein